MQLGWNKVNQGFTAAVNKMNPVTGFVSDTVTGFNPLPEFQSAYGKFRSGDVRGGLGDTAWGAFDAASIIGTLSTGGAAAAPLTFAKVVANVGRKKLAQQVAQKGGATTAQKLGTATTLGTSALGTAMSGGGTDEMYTPRPGGDPRRGLAASRAQFQANKIMREQAAAQAQAQAEADARLRATVANAGRSEYGQATGQARSMFDINKKAAGKELRNLMTQLGQQYSGGVQDMSMGAAQLGLDTSPGALDVGIDYLGEARNVAELGGREQYAGTIAKLTQQLAQQRASAAAARQTAQQNAILQAYLAEQGLLG